MKRKIGLSCLLLISFFQSSALKIDRVIVGCDLHREYIDFWPLVAKAWQQIVGVRPTLALIAPAHIYVDESVGDVIRFDPIPGIPTHLQAQVIRLLLPTLFPDEGCIISDMDMIPCSKDYFVNSVASIPDDCFVVYRDRAYPPSEHHYPMCYMAAKGSVFSEIFGVYNKDEFSTKIKQWYESNLGWHTDQLIVYNALAAWPQAHRRCVKLGHGVPGRIDRGAWRYNAELARKGHYIDAHLLKPYHQYHTAIDQLAHDLGIDHQYNAVRDLPQVKNQPLSSFSPYLIPLLVVLKETQGPVLEMGTDNYASMWLHQFCAYENRFLATAEGDVIKLSFFSHLISANHLLWLIMNPRESQEKYPTLDKWDNVYSRYQWSIAIINQLPLERRLNDILKMRPYTKVFIVPSPDQEILALAKTFHSFYCYDRYEKSVLIMSDEVDVRAWFTK
jgi:hypothetical protein